MDRVPDDEPLPPWAEEMLERAFVRLGSPNEPVDDAVVAVIAMDLTATLGWAPEQATAVARRAARSHQGDGHPAFDAAEDVQQWLHDIFLDTTWPACPEHPRHPLELSDDDQPMWTCPPTNRPVCALGQLGTVSALDDAVAAVNRDRLEAEEARTATAVARFQHWWQGRRNK